MLNRLKRFALYFHRLKIRLLAITRKIKLPAGRGVRLYEVLMGLSQIFTGDNFDLRAFGMAFNFFLAFFPTLIFMIMLLPYLPVPNLEERALAAITSALPEATHSLLEGIVGNTFQRSGVGLLSLTLLSTLFFASRGVRFMMRAFRKTDPSAFKDRTWLQERVLAILIYFGILGIVTAGLVMFHFTSVLKGYLEDYPGFWAWVLGLLLSLVNAALNVGILFVAMGFIYRRAPNVKQKFRFTSAGAVVSAVLLYLGTAGLQIYFKNFTDYNPIYGNLAAVMVLLIWFYWISVAILMGYEINLSIRRAGIQRGIVKQNKWVERRSKPPTPQEPS